MKGGNSLLREFKAFALKGNVLDLAVAVLVGAAFQKIVTSLVNDVLMPPLGLLLGRVDFRSLFFSLDGRRYPSLEAAREAGAPVISYGSFLQNGVDFLLVAGAVFLVIRLLNRSREKPQGPPPKAETRECPHCLSVIPQKASRCAHCTQPVQFQH